MRPNHRAFRKVWNYASVNLALGQVLAIITSSLPIH